MDQRYNWGYSSSSPKMIKEAETWINKKLRFINYKLKIAIVILAFFVGLTIRMILTP